MPGIRDGRQLDRRARAAHRCRKRRGLAQRDQGIVGAVQDGDSVHRMAGARDAVPVVEPGIAQAGSRLRRAIRSRRPSP